LEREEDEDEKRANILGTRTHLMGLWMLMLTVVSGGQNEEPRADDEGCQEFGHVFEGARGRVDFGHDVWGWNNGANYRVLSIFVVSLASAG